MDRNEKKPKLPTGAPEQKPKLVAPPTPSKEMSELMGRLRLLEERYSGLRKKSNYTEQNTLKDIKDLFNEVRVLQETLAELKAELSELNEKMTKLSLEVDNAVRKEELNVLSKYLDFWEPLNFITLEEAKQLVSREKN